MSSLKSIVDILFRFCYNRLIQINGDLNMPSKRYSVINQYIKSGCIAPQVCHGLNNLWKLVPTMSQEQKNVFLDWAENSEYEIHLHGGDDEALEKLYETVKSIDGIPVSKFNEPGLRNSCTVVSFVASERIVAANNYIRWNRVPMKNVVNILSGLGFVELGIDGSTEFVPLTLAEITVAEYISKLATAS